MRRGGSVRGLPVTQAILRPRKEFPWRVGMAVLKVSHPLPIAVFSSIQLNGFVVREGDL